MLVLVSRRHDNRSESPDGFLNLTGQIPVVLALESQGGTEYNSHRPRPGHPPCLVKNTVDPIDSDWNNWPL